MENLGEEKSQDDLEPLVITDQFLRGRGLEDTKLKRFRGLFPFGAPRTVAAAKILAIHFDLADFGFYFLDEEDQEGFKRAIKESFDEKWVSLSAVMSENREVRESASVVYHREVAPALKSLREAQAALDRAQRKAQKAFKKTVGPSDKAYNEAQAATNKSVRTLADRLFIGLFPKDRGSV